MSKTAHEDTEGTIVTTEGVLGGKPRLDGRRISVLDVVELLNVGCSISETASTLNIPEEEVRAASAYYRHHRKDIEPLERKRREKHEDLRNGSAVDSV